MNYKESEVTGTSWQRAWRVNVENPLNGQPTITFFEEQAFNTGTEVILKQVGSISCAFNPTDTFPGIDPETNQPVGRDITHGEVYALLYSLYMDLAGKRDNPPEVTP